ncbi:hypothetical protein D0T25_27780 [Duganella sp. BJB488]|nr:hypothetical protein D0T26_27240 [Duganella sp. BJB489]RFP14249.1 hypothetical protein D0T25_27780 [Duganella sp. BJB488]RFP30186.1 hypothetical protein D0T24_28480 [Duganella sp. BJB480]
MWRCYWLKATGDGWQTRMGVVLKEWLGIP